MIDEAREAHEEELAERDRIGEKAPAAEAAFGGAARPLTSEAVEEAIEQLAHPRDADGKPVQRAPVGPMPSGFYQWWVPVPRPRRWTQRENIAAAMAYLRRRR